MQAWRRASRSHCPLSSPLAHRWGPGAWLTMSGLQSRSRGLDHRPDQFVELRGHSFVALGPDASDVQLPALPLCFPAQSLAQRQSTPESARLSHNYTQLPGV